MSDLDYKRIDSLDLIRGIAIPSILIMNIFSMALPPVAYWVPTWTENAGWVDMAVHGFQVLFVESRFMSIFTMLFGAGLALQRDRYQTRGIDPRSYMRRRLFWLLVFGLVHGLLLWHGDILTLYAIVGFLVLPATRWGTKRLLIVGSLLITIGQIPMILVVIGSVLTGENLMEVPPLPFDAAAVDSARAEWTSLPSRLAVNAKEYAAMLAAGPIILFWQTAGVMMIGMALYRRGFFSNRDAWKHGVYSLLLGFIIGVGVLAGRYSVGLKSSAAMGLLGVAMLAGLFMAIGYMSLLVPLASSSGILARSLRNAGRTAFTLYISQTIISLLLFVVFLRPMWGTWGRGPLLIYVFLFAVCQVIFAHWWQTRKGMGPFEALWRKLAGKTD